MEMHGRPGGHETREESIGQRLKRLRLEQGPVAARAGGARRVVRLHLPDRGGVATAVREGAAAPGGEARRHHRVPRDRLPARPDRGARAAAGRPRARAAARRRAGRTGAARTGARPGRGSRRQAARAARAGRARDGRQGQRRLPPRRRAARGGRRGRAVRPARPPGALRPARLRVRVLRPAGARGRAVRALPRRGPQGRRRAVARSALRDRPQLRPERHGQPRPRRAGRRGGARPRPRHRGRLHARPPLLVARPRRARREQAGARARERPQGDRAARDDRGHDQSRARTHPRRGDLAQPQGCRRGGPASRCRRATPRTEPRSRGCGTAPDPALAGRGAPRRRHDRRRAGAHRGRDDRRQDAGRAGHGALRARRRARARPASICPRTTPTAKPSRSSRRTTSGARRRSRAGPGRGCCAARVTRSRRSTCSSAPPSWGCARPRRTPAPSGDGRARGRAPRAVFAGALGAPRGRRDAAVPRRDRHRAARGRRPARARPGGAVARRDRDDPRRHGGGGRAAALDPRARRRPLPVPGARRATTPCSGLRRGRCAGCGRCGRRRSRSRCCGRSPGS